MNDNQIETLSKAIDSLIDLRARLSLAGSQQNGDKLMVRNALVNVTNARYLVACLATGEEWNP